MMPMKFSSSALIFSVAYVLRSSGCRGDSGEERKRTQKSQTKKGRKSEILTLYGMLTQRYIKSDISLG